MTALHEATILELQDAMRAGQVTAARLTRHFLERIEAYDRSGPRLNAVLEVNPEALEIAEALDRERASAGARGPLHGIPVLLKDNVATADRLHTSAGSLALKDVVAPEDAYLVARLRDAGAVILGKANMTDEGRRLVESRHVAPAPRVSQQRRAIRPMSW